MNDRLVRTPARRGSSLLLVTTAMGAAVILSGAYLASRANGALVGGNLSASSIARIQTESALAITGAALTGSGDWRTDHAAGLYLLQETPETLVRVDLLDLATNQPPDAGTVDVRANITSRRDGIERFAQADFFVPLESDAQAVDVDLGEFALFAGDSIELGSEALVRTWECSPGAGRGEPLRVATSTGESRGIRLHDSSMIVGGIEYRPTRTAHHGGSLPVDELPDRIIIHQPAPPLDDESTPLQSGLDRQVDGDQRVEELRMSGGDRILLNPGANLMVEGDLVMGRGSVLEVEGTSTVVVKGDLTIRGGSIEVAESARFTVHVGGDLDLTDARVVEPNGTERTWVPDIDRVSFVTTASRASIPSWRIRGATLLKGQLYAPSAQVSIEQRTVIIGRIAAQSIRMSGSACLLYDPTIDRRNGYTAPDRRLFETNGRVLEPIARMESLATEQLQQASTEMGIPISAGTEMVHPTRAELVAEPTKRRGGERARRFRDRIKRPGPGREFLDVRRSSRMQIRGIGMNAHQFKEHGR
ncbi:MAG: hypothetical protein VX641_01175 [Planctomycetota bacterium]|nr:hypothetical protein [Planctomycetota bacterium]